MLEFVSIEQLKPTLVSIDSKNRLRIPHCMLTQFTSACLPCFGDYIHHAAGTKLRAGWVTNEEKVSVV